MNTVYSNEKGIQILIASIKEIWNIKKRYIQMSSINLVALLILTNVMTL